MKADDTFELGLMLEAASIERAPKSPNGQFAVLRIIGGSMGNRGTVALYEMRSRKLLWRASLKKVGARAVSNSGIILAEEVSGPASCSLVAIENGAQIWRKNFRRFFEFAGFSPDGAIVTIYLLPSHDEKRFYLATGEKGGR